MKRLFYYFIVLMAFGWYAESQARTVSETDSLALIALYNSTSGASWTNKWDLNRPVTSWHGVSVDGGRVSRLVFSSNELSGPLPADLSKLTKLERLWLIRNNLSGSIPADLGKLTNLTSLILFSSQLSGSIPTELSKLTNLTAMVISSNQLSGSIPTELSKLTNLTILDLSSNQLSGSIPTELSKLTNLTSLYLSFNDLSGSVPADLNKLTELKTLYLLSNQLSSLPSLSALTKLSDVQVQNNRLDFGDIIPNVAKLNSYAPQTPIGKGNIYPPNTSQTFMVTTPGAGNTYQWFFNEDTLKGETRRTLTVTNTKVGYYHCEIKNAAAPALTLTSDREIVAGLINTADSLVLVKFYNMTKGANWKNRWDLSKPVMSWYGVTVKAGRVSKLDLSNNRLSGQLPAELGNLTGLTALDLGFNQLSGSIPKEIGKLVGLKYLTMTSNQLTGSIPKELGNLTNIDRFISFSRNKLTGTIPKELGQITKMAELFLYSNQLSGSIPAELGNLTNLKFLYLYANQLSGAVPETFKNLSKLEQLYLYDNRLNSLPNLGSLSKLSVIGLRVQRNYLDFRDIEPNLPKMSSFSYYNPQTIRDGQSYFQAVRSNLTLSVEVRGTGNTYQWYHNGDSVAGATNKALFLNNIQVAKVGRYHCEVKNSSVAGLTLSSVADTVVINTSPTALTLSGTTIAENKAIGTTIGTLTTTDATPNDKHTYTLSGADAASFKIMGNMLQNAAVFNFEKKKSYSITITSTDRGKDNISKNFTITVTDVDETPTALPNPNPDAEPVITLYPNPSSGFIRFRGLDSAQPVVIQIFNSVGQVVKAYNQVQPSYDLSDLAKGLYIAVVQVGSKNQTFTFILN